MTPPVISGPIEMWRVVWTLPLAGFVAGFVDSIGGGGGLITVPALLAAGVPPLLLLGTNKCLAAPGSFVATLRYARAGLLPPLARRRWVLLVSLALAAGATGAAVSQAALITANLRHLVPAMLTIIIFFLAKRWFFDEPRRRRELAQRPPQPGAAEEGNLESTETTFAVAAIAAYDGLFGPGTGTFFLSYFEHRGTPTVRANAATKVFNLSSNVGALVYFACAGRVIWSIGLTVAVAMMAGNYVGAGLVLKEGRVLVRVTVLAVTSLVVVRFLWTG